MTQTYVQIVLVSVLWGGWPLLLRWAGPVGHTGAFLLSAFALIPLSFMALATGFQMPQQQPLIKVVLAGVIMGAGMIAYNQVLTGGKIEISSLVPIVNTSMLAVTTIGGIIFFAESITPQKVAGFLLMLVGIYLLKPTG